MRRLAVFCGGFAAGIFAAQYLLAVDWLLPVGLACIGAGVLTLLLPAPQRKRAVLCLVGAALALGWDWLYIRQVSAPMEALAATRQTLTMTLTDYPTETRFGAKVTVRAEGLPGKLVYYGDSPLLQLCPGQRMTEDVYLQSASRIRDDDVTVFNSKGVFLMAYSRGTPRFSAGSQSSPRWWPVRLGHAMQARIRTLFDGDDAGFLLALLTGQKGGLSAQADVDLSEAGVYHILAVSGMHCAYLLALVAFLTGRHRRRLTAAVAIPVLAFYAVLAGGSPSVVRACVMLSLLTAAPLFRREKRSAYGAFNGAVPHFGAESLCGKVRQPPAFLRGRDGAALADTGALPSVGGGEEARAYLYGHRGKSFHNRGLSGADRAGKRVLL